MATLYVYMNGRAVGEYTQAKDGAEEFVYSDAWLDNRNAIPVSLSLPLTDKRHRGETVFNYFDNLLPDNREIRERIQARVGARTSRAFDLLAEIGRDCIGAIQLLPDKTKPDVKKTEGIPLGESEIADTLRHYKNRPLGMSEDDDFRISLAGAQEKTAFLFHKGTWHKPTGATPTTHIFKLPIGKIEHSGMDLSESVENEWLCLKILEAFDLAVAEAEIATFEDQKALIVKRFDRTPANDNNWIIRNPVEDMCQANGISPALKYESDGGPGISTVMELLASSMEPEKDRRHFMKSVFVFWLLGAIDGHAKNFSLFLHRGGRFRLTPLYDVLSAHPMVAARQLEYRDLKMAMALHGNNTHYKAHEIMPRHWYNEARHVRFPQTDMEAIIDSVISKTDTVVDNIASCLPTDFPEHVASPVFEGIKKQAQRFTRGKR